MEFSKAVAEAKVLFFSGKGLILLLRGHHRGEFDTVVATDTPLA
jgi:hypothetical protein